MKHAILSSILASSGLLLAACGGTPAPTADPPETPASEPASAPASGPTSAPAGHHGAQHHEGHMHHGQKHGHRHHHHGFENPEEWAGKWDTAERDGWQKPDAVLAAIAPKPTDLIADIGAGTGYFAMRLAQKAPEGTVYAIDLQPQMVEYLGQRAAKMGLTNVVPIKAGPDDARIPQPVDLVMLTNTYHHIADRTPYFTRLAPSLKPGGRVAIVDYKLQFEGKGPPPAMRLAPDTVEAEMKAAGYRVVLRDEQMLERQYILIFDRGEAGAAGGER